MNFRNGNFELKEIQTLTSHTNGVFSIAWNPASGVDGSPSMFSSCGADKTVRIWKQNMVTKAFYCMAVLRKQHTDTIKCCAWCPSGNFLATSSLDGTVAIWENVEGKFSCVHVLQGIAKFAPSISWNGFGTMLVTCVPYTRIRIWKILSSEVCEDVSGVLADLVNVKIIQWHPLKDILFSSGLEATIQVWEEDVDTRVWNCHQFLGESYRVDTGEWNCAQILRESSRGPRVTVCAFSFNSTSDKMVTCCDDFTIKIWSSIMKRTLYGEEKSKWKHLYTISGYHDLGLFSINWSREGVICSGSTDAAIYCFGDATVQVKNWVDWPEYRLILKKEQAHLKDVTCVEWSSTDSRHLLTASEDKTIKLWELVPS